MSSESPATEKPVRAPERTQTRPPARERILDVAGPLFYREGYRAVGVDRVIGEADEAKGTVNKHFPSKDDLIVAWIGRAEEQSRAIVPPIAGQTPLYDYADRMIAIAGQPRCLGCTYQGSAAEFQNPEHPAHRAALGVKRRVLVDLEARAAAQGLAEPRAVAERVFVFLEGVWASVRMFGPEAPLAGAREAVRRLAA